MNRLLPQGILAVLVLMAALVPARAQQQQVVRIAATGYVRDGHLQVGGSGAAGRVAREGWLAARLKEKNLTLDWMAVAGDTGPVINEAFASGRIAFASYGDLPSLILNAAGVRTQMIVPLGRGQDQFLLVPKGSSARSILDLKGKRISLHRSRPWELAFYKLIAQYGLKNTDFHILNMDPHAGVAALASGQVDALFSNNGYQYEDRNIGKVIWTSKNDFLKKMRAEIWASKPYIDAHPDIAQLVATAFVRAEYYNSQDSHRQEALEEATTNGTSMKTVLRVYDNPAISWKDNWSPLYDGLVWAQYRLSAQFAFDRRMINRKVDAQDLLQPKFVNTALSQLHLQDYWKPWSGATPPKP